MTKKTRHLGNESGKSSNRFFGGSQPRGHGASTGDGRTSNKSLLGKIVPVFKSGEAAKPKPKKYPWW